MPPGRSMCITGSPYTYPFLSATFANFRVRTLIANDYANRSHNSPGGTSADFRVKMFALPRRTSGFKITVLPRRFRDAPKQITRTLGSTCRGAEFLIFVRFHIDPSPAQPAARSRLDAATSSDQIEQLQFIFFF